MVILLCDDQATSILTDLLLSQQGCTVSQSDCKAVLEVGNHSLHA